jgi:hypothetical protein
MAAASVTHNVGRELDQTAQIMGSEPEVDNSYPAKALVACAALLPIQISDIEKSPRRDSLQISLYSARDARISSPKTRLSAGNVALPRALEMAESISVRRGGPTMRLWLGFNSQTPHCGAGSNSARVRRAVSVHRTSRRILRIPRKQPADRLPAFLDRREWG